MVSFCMQLVICWDSLYKQIVMSFPECVLSFENIEFHIPNPNPNPNPSGGGGVGGGIQS